MSLQRRLMITITLLLIALLAANLVTNVYNARSSFYEQLNVHAQDTATSLGFTISQAALAKDIVQVSSMIDVIFDRGYYHRIAYQDLEGNDIVLREASLTTRDVPQWFVDWVRLPIATGQADVASGWYQLGSLQVDSHPGFVYQNLWRAFGEQIVVFLLSVAASYILLGLGLKLLLRPLNKVEAQANAICERKFEVQTDLPSIPELRKTVEAMNNMALKVKAMFSQQLSMNDHLLAQSRTDVLTGLANRRDFDDRLNAHLSADLGAGSGMIVLLHAQNLERVNLQSGRDLGDQYIVSISRSINAEMAAFPNAISSRHRGTDFAIFVPDITEEESQLLVKQLQARLQEADGQNKESSVVIGAIYTPSLAKTFDENTDSPRSLFTQLMAHADKALTQAQAEPSSYVYWQRLEHSEDSQVLMSIQQWQKWLNQALVADNLRWFYQPVWYVIHGQKRLLFNEVLSHIHWQNQDFAAGYFVPMATRLQKISLFDRLVLEKLAEESIDLPEHLCVNVSLSSLRDQEYLTHLENILSKQPALAKRITFELPASGLKLLEQAVRDFAEAVTSRGAGLSLHHFGRDTANFSFLQSLKLDCLKIDRSLIQDITNNPDGQFFIRSLVGVAKSCDVMILAEGVETQEQWELLLELGIQGGQGYWLGRPQSEPMIA